MNILEEIVSRRRRRVEAEGHELGSPVPSARSVPVAPFGSDPFLICEIKRRSPSRGAIAEGLDAGERARQYAGRGVRSISVLTEPDHFAGSLRDLMDAKTAAPGTGVLRKDFLLDEEDVIVSHRAGADAVLLIASVLSASELGRLYRRAKGLGMEALVEIHSEGDAVKARRIRPSLTGINCRDLATFAVDRLEPLRIARLVDWPTRLVFESGIRDEEDALLALSSGFHGILAGESVMRDPGVIDSILRAFGRASGGDGSDRAGPRGATPGDFWRKLAERARPGRPLVKICGITREEDARLAADLGADILGFILAPSPRRVDPGLPARIRLPGVLKAAVVTDAEGASTAARLAGEGAIDAVQLHGEEKPEECFRAAFPYYKALRVRGSADVEAISSYRCPRVLVDAYSGEARGGTGRAVPRGLVEQVRSRGPLWLAGGVAPENVREICETFSPELLDASSRLESAPGIKDPARLKSFFKEIGRG